MKPSCLFLVQLGESNDLSFCLQRTIKYIMSLKKFAVKPGLVRQGSGGEGNTERVKVYLRIRPLSEMERQRGEEQVKLSYSIRCYNSVFHDTYSVMQYMYLLLN